MVNHMFGVDELLKLQRLGGCALSPDGARVVVEIARHSVEADEITTGLHVHVLSEGGWRELKLPGLSSTQPRFSPDGERLYFLAREEEGTQLWSLEWATGETTRHTEERDVISSHHPSPDGGSVLFVRTETPEGAAPTTHSGDTLLFRHWDEWRDRHRNRLCRLDLASGEVERISPAGHDCPPLGLHGVRDHDVSPTGDALALVYNPDEVPARGTNMTVMTTDWPECSAVNAVTTSAACEINPRFSPDGTRLAFQGMRRPGFEADRFEIWVREGGEVRSLTDSLDRSVRTFQWSRDGASLLFDADDRGRRSVYRVGLDGSPPVPLIEGRFASLVDELPGGDLLVVLESMASPGELYRWCPATGDNTRLTSVSADEPCIGGLNPAQDLWFEGADGDRVHGLLVEPATRPAGERIPLVVFIHGGPQGAFGDHFHYRWNAQVIANAGYGVLLLNPRGSTGYGQKFCDQISGDWGGRILTDIHAGIDHALAAVDWLDPERVGATGGSFGGFMMNWFQGHTDRFKALVCHAGIFNLWNLYYGTEELWFPEWEFGGAPHEDPTLYDRWNPIRHVAQWKTPMLILHGQLDYRVPYLEGVAAFTALQTRDIPSRIVLFPDEGHWINKPQNSVRWYAEMLAFFETHLR